MKNLSMYSTPLHQFSKSHKMYNIIIRITVKTNIPKLIKIIFYIKYNKYLFNTSKNTNTRDHGIYT